VSKLTAKQQGELDRLLASDPGLASGLRRCLTASSVSRRATCCSAPCRSGLPPAARCAPHSCSLSRTPCAPRAARTTTPSAEPGGQRLSSSKSSTVELRCCSSRASASPVPEEALPLHPEAVASAGCDAGQSGPGRGVKLELPRDIVAVLLGRPGAPEPWRTHPGQPRAGAHAPRSVCTGAAQARYAAVRRAGRVAYLAFSIPRDRR
jgi:hypothetical protein